MASSSSSSGSPAGYAVGIDEAGRGPVLGPLVYGAAYCPVDRQAQLADLGVADSKTLTADDRERLLAAIDACAFLRYELDAIPSATISALMLRRRKYNLNLISHDSAVGLVRRIMASGVAVAEIYVDTVGDPDKYERKLSALFPQAKCVVRKKADSLFPIVSAASICAKTARDRLLSEWSFKEEGAGDALPFSRAFGSGYPSDPATKQWLVDHCDRVFGFPDLVRFSWQTTKTILEQRCVSVAWPDDDDDGNGQKENRKRTITSFFGSAAAPPAAPTRHHYFTRRRMKLLEASH
ncbi:unnamed protein product (mitochondrion) [Plasmodiophora brassicae]|uniref:Ribonuclease n=1 Tax=Plasmodiophora brassicae TaxID=37360 RepID=A0A0G4INT2_PLABS|nr:hypothetical protein PBRA_005429 [Plasmodiophora brassicae]SPR01781.1 unnamed protein product [Plasmodiophora brassicae]